MNARHYTAPARSGESEAVVLADDGSGLLAPIPNAPARYPFALTAARSFSIVECRGSMPASSILETVAVEQDDDAVLS